jgi:hypothetical protein
MDRNALKIIAIVTMTIDHIGFFLLNSDTTLYLATRIIGRIAFPLFAFMIVEGFFHTRDLKSYVKRLLVLGLAVEFILVMFYAVYDINLIIIPYTPGHLVQFNIMWTLLVGLFGVYIINQKNKDLYGFLPLLLLVSYFLPFGFYGFGLMLIWGWIRHKKISYLFILILSLVYMIFPLIGEPSIPTSSYIQLFSLLALPFVYFYNSKSSIKYRFLFYWYYPAHAVILLLIKIYLL